MTRLHRGQRLRGFAAFPAVGEDAVETRVGRVVAVMSLVDAAGNESRVHVFIRLQDTRDVIKSLSAATEETEIEIRRRRSSAR